MSEELVNIHDETETRIKDSISIEAFKDICNIENTKRNRHQDYSEMKTPPFPTSLEGCKQLERTPLSFQNKENSRNFKERYKSTDSFIQRLSYSQSISNFPKEEEGEEEIANYDSCKLKVSSPMRTSDTQAMTYRSHLEQETSHILDRVKKLKEDLDTMRSPFRNRRSLQLD